MLTTEHQFDIPDNCIIADSAVHSLIQISDLPKIKKKCFVSQELATALKSESRDTLEKLRLTVWDADHWKNLLYHHLEWLRHHTVDWFLALYKHLSDTNTDVKQMIADGQGRYRWSTPPAVVTLSDASNYFPSHVSTIWFASKLNIKLYRTR